MAPRPAERHCDAVNPLVAHRPADLRAEAARRRAPAQFGGVVAPIGRAPELGAHTGEVLNAVGIGLARLHELRERHIVS